ncbi:putative mitochondrial chaperone BCS1-B [Pseudocercospora fuligena]|uniref:Putative mitochondrial chaperone BCS1-B n=1 Tax=Pseudocercospora fuligena TaxID=685502 RepID=A0A8H6R9C3_9PEZI|nr:putative mitochondrial chaperone BCS1-B [Pseudocercospora fuligena]
MDFRKMAKAMPSSNDTLALTDLPPNILESLIPGYGLISRYIAATFGIDISIFVSIGIVLLALSKGGQYLFSALEKWFRNLFMSSVYIDEHDDLFDMVMGWLAEDQRTGSRRSLRAKTQKGSKADDAFDDAPGDALDENGMFDYTKWSARLPPRYEPYYGRNYLLHQGRLFFFKRSVKQGGQRVQVTWSNAEDDLLQIDCIGRSSEPIKDLLRTIKIWSLNRVRGTTTIRHPTAKDRSRFSGSWSKTASRPSRPMETVILDAMRKSMIVRDMNEYLHPASPRWYATRGIPYRRGYLFHGPPGTGKTSLSFALAGIFGLEIYAISLQEPTLTEGDLLQLFNGLPRRCIVLLEDVDAAGLLRDSQSKDDDKPKGAAGGKGKDGEKEKDGDKGKNGGEAKKDSEYTMVDTLKELTRELKVSNTARGGRRGGTDNNTGNANRAPGTGISLSGLLNAIDGVASAEGRVLIMTTNHPEKLDAALVRPGRVDRKVAFQLAMKAQISELFTRMYAASDQVPDMEPRISLTSNGRIKAYANGSATKPFVDGQAGKGTNGSLNGHSEKVKSTNQLSSMSAADLEELALEFAGLVPADTFTPAEIQNHLMKYKKEPRNAVELAEEWTRDLIAEKTKEAEERDRAQIDEE